MLRKIILSFFFVLIAIKPALADEKFAHRETITYKILESGLSEVTETVSIENKVSDYYPTSQTFTYQSLNLGNIKIIDEKGEFEPEIVKEGNTTKVTVNFREKNAGISKKTNFSLKYQTTDIATLNGEVWQIIIPGVKNIEFYEDFNIILELPENFPEIQYSSIMPKSKWLWGKNEIKDKGIFLIFGKEQFYKFDLKYHLSNSGLTPVLDSITIPPDTNYQKSYLTKIEPEPAFSEKDIDGNWIFWFDLKPGAKINIKAEVFVSLVFLPEKSEKLSEEQIDLFTREQKYWNYGTFVNISSKISELKTPEEIYDFTVNTLKYNYNRLNKAPERFTALEALQNPINSICTDFTNVFISLLRKNKIPAREVNGYAQTQNLDLQPLSLEKDILHAWPEFYDFNEQKWIMVDPTWESTTGGIDFYHKLDLNHIAFVIKGKSSEFPFPPGSFKDPTKTSKDIEAMVLSKKEFEKKINKNINEKLIDLFFDFDEDQISGIKTEGELSVQNKSVNQIQNLEVIMEIEGKVTSHKIDSLIPYEISKSTFSFPKTNFWERKKTEIKVRVGGKSFTKNVNFTPIFLWRENAYIFLFGLFLMFLTSIVFIIKFVKKKEDKTIQ